VKGVAAAVGIAIVAVHGVAFVAYSDRARGQDLVVDLHATPLASPALAIDASLPPGIATRVTTDDSAVGVGLAHRRWTARYQGGFARSVGATQLVGPFQDPAARACSGRVIVGQTLLDGGPHSIAATMQTMIDAELKGESIFGVGDYKRVADVTLAWAELAKHPEDKGLIDAAPHGYVRVTARLVFDRVEIPLVLALLPQVAKGTLAFSVSTRATLDFDNRVIQWASDKIGGNKLATRLARRQIDQQLVTTLAPPPPFDLPDGQRLEFTYCDESPTIVDRAYAALPFAVTIGRVAGDARVLPARFGHGPRDAPAPGTVLALDLELDALNALLFELWRSGFLDRRLAEIGLDRQFNTDPLVTEFLSIRISPLKLALPPVLTADAKGLHLAADGRVTIESAGSAGTRSAAEGGRGVSIDDGSARTIGRVYGGLGFAFGAGKDLPVSVDLGDLELSCERTATTLVPCFADLVGALRDRGADFHGALTTGFAKLLADIFVAQRVGASGVPVDLVIHGVRPTVTLAPPNGTLHLVLDAELAPAK